MGLSGWDSSKKLKLVIDGSKVDENLINFPVNITLSSETGQTGFDATAVFDELSTVSGTKKIAVTTTVSGVETELYTEIERWDWANEEANLWIKVPIVSPDTDTELFLYYDGDHTDNTNYIGDTGDTPARDVWDSNFVGIWHMAQDPNGDVADAIKDSTSNVKHGTPGGSMTSADLVDGKIGKAIDFDGDDDALDLGTIGVGDALRLNGSDVTISTCIRNLSGDAWQRIIDKSSAGTGADGYAFTMNALKLSLQVNGNVWSTNNDVVAYGIDYHVTGVITASSFSMYVNGVNKAGAFLDAGSAVQPPDVTTNAKIATWNHSTAREFKGVIEELRVSDTARSTAWIKATYHSNWNDFVTFSSIFDPDDWDSSKKLKLVIDSSKVDEDLTNFPINVTLSSGTGQTGFDATAVFDELSTVSGTKKIAITTIVSGVETELYTEIERWDWSNEKANLWIKVPTVSSGTNTELFLYYDSNHTDNTTYIGDTGDTPAQSVWDSNFKLVMHMSQDPSGGSDAIKDSTSNANHGTSIGSMVSGDLVDGKIGKAIEFNGTSQSVDLGDVLDSIMAGSSAKFTVESVAWPNVNTGSMALNSKYDSASNNRGFLFRIMDSVDFFRLSIHYENKTVSYYRDFGGDTVIQASTWYSFAGKYDASQGSAGDGKDRVKLFINGVAEVLSPLYVGGTVSNIEDNTAHYGIGAILNTTGGYKANGFNGIICESRISNILRSAAWIKATYHSNWNDFVTFSEEEEGITFVFTNPIPVHLSTVYGTTKQLYLTTTISGPAPEYIYDADFFDSFDVQIGTTVSGINSGSPAASNIYFSTPSGIDYSWYMKASSSGVDDTSQTYTFHNRFLASGTTEVNGVLTSGIGVRLYLRDTGELLGSTTSTISGAFNIETQYNAEFYCVALSPYTDTNSLIYDFLEVD